jgi:hypothetical protein
VKKKDSRILKKRKQNLNKRLERRAWPEQSKPMFTARNIEYEMAEKMRAIDCGGLGAFHMLARRTGLIPAIDERLHLLKRHLPYHESDHVLNIAYNTLTGGTCLDDIELRRNDETYMDALGAQRIPDPTTAGDFTRRFSGRDVEVLMDAANSIRPKIWKKGLKKSECKEAIIDVDGTLAPTTGECKEGMGMSYNGVWSYHPLLVSLANTAEPLYLLNRSGNRPSHEGAVEWVDRAVELVSKSFRRVCLRGDTDFSLTEHFDRWTEAGLGFAFGMDAMANLVHIAEGLSAKRWRLLKRRERTSKTGQKRRRPDNVKEQIVVEKGYRNLKLQKEHVAEFDYTPVKCARSYRMIVLRKSISVEQGQIRLWDEVRYFLYITNIEDKTPAEVVFFCNERCNQENLIEQLKNGLNALRMPVGDLVSNWAYMVMASLAWSLKAWFALLTDKYDRRNALLTMEFPRFLNAIVRIPTQVIRGGRRIVLRILGYNEWTKTFLDTCATIHRLKLT